ncbi:MAG: hypothetical protein JXA93_13285, partial [Anaerolineae bacterium]|nr:hypothetical protein [Anaerolineae bacterium]
FGSRTQLLAILDRMMDESQKVHGAVQQGTFFDMPAFAPTGLQATLPEVSDVSRREVLAWEKELVGAYISDHPLSRVWADLENAITVLTGQIDDTMAEQSVTVAGMINFVRRITTKKGQAMAFAQIEDLQGTVEVVIFPSLWEATAEMWQPEQVVVVRGKVSLRGREPSIIADSVTNEITTVKALDETGAQPERKAANGSVHMHIIVPRRADVEETIRRLGQVFDLLQEYPGSDRFSLYVGHSGNGDVQIEFPNDTAGHCLALEGRLREMLGAGTVRVEPMGNWELGS